MLDNKEEYNRVLSNPENVILSEGLADLLGEEEDSSSPEESLSLSGFHAELEIEKSQHVCNIKKIVRLKDASFLFKVFAPTFPLQLFLEDKIFCLHMKNSLFALKEDAPVSYKENGILTFTARRIFKDEEV